MRVVYSETSAVLSWLLGDERTQRVAKMIDFAPKVVTSALTLIEAKRGILRATRERCITAADSVRLMDLLAGTISAWDIMEMDHDIQARAGESFPAEPVRTLDAIHLATALEFRRVFSELSILTFDERIMANLEPLGLQRARLA